MADTRPETFGIRVGRMMEDGKRHQLRQFKSILRTGLRTLVYTTRVDTGQARSNWIVTRSAPSTRIIKNFPRGSKGSTAEASAAFAVARGNKVIDAVNYRNLSVWMTNNVPYIRVINDKYGDHMVERALVAIAAKGGIGRVL